MPNKKPRAKVPKTKTFGGCWTCRRRKVKCDNLRPKCSRCSKDFQCEGYDVELFWVPSGYDQESEQSMKGRKAMLLRDERIPTSCKVAEVHEMLVDLDEAEREAATLHCREVGPFSVFSVIRPTTKARAQPSHDETINDTTVTNEVKMFEDSDFSIPFDTDGEIWMETSPDISVKHSTSDLQLVGANLNSTFRGSVRPRLLDFRLRTHTFTERSTRELMHNYITIVADLLQPANHHQNPYKSIYVPTALAGSNDSLCGVGILETSDSHVAVFHGILSVSAFHLRGTASLTGRSSFDKLGRLHRGKAIESLQKALLGDLTRLDHHAAISAMMSLVSSDLMDGGMNEFWIHLDGCERLQQLIPNSQTLQESCKQLRNVCSFMTTMARSTELDFVPLSWPEFLTSEDVAAHIGSPFNLNDHSLEFTYGITGSLASFIHTTTKLSRHFLYYTGNDQALPDSLLVAIEIHRDNIANWSLAQEPFSSIYPLDYETLSVIRHHAMAFYNAICIHFHTLLLPTSPNTIAAHSLATVEYLISAEALKSAHGARHGWNSMAPIVWPGFIASCEAPLDDRVLWRKWWTSVQQYRIGSIARLWGVVREVWESRDAGSVEIPGWAPILRASGLRIISGG